MQGNVLIHIAIAQHSMAEISDVDTRVQELSMVCRLSTLSLGISISRNDTFVLDMNGEAVKARGNLYFHVSMFRAT